MPEDSYHKFGDGLEAPALEADPVTPDDSNDLVSVTRALYIGGTGNVTVRMKGKTTSVTFVAVPVGILPIRVDRVLVSGTTATSIVAMW